MSRNAIVFVPRTASARAGLPIVGAHQLRHTTATGLLRAGASLGDVGQVLRHDRDQTTALYAAVDARSLEPLARPWPTATAS
jgi:integrase